MKLRQWLVRVCVSLAIPIVLLVATVQLRYTSRIFPDSSSISRMPVALILGASVKRDGTPSSALRDRLEKGIELYEKGVVKRLFLTGDDGAYHVDEITVMTAYMRLRGIPDDAVVVDGHGYRTYESCKRAKIGYGISRAIIVTQRFHLGRALYLCNQLGVNSVGIIADRTMYDKLALFWLREIPASLKAWWEIHVKAPRSPELSNR